MKKKKERQENSLTAPTSLLSSPMPNATVATTFQQQKMQVNKPELVYVKTFWEHLGDLTTEKIMRVTLPL